MARQASRSAGLGGNRGRLLAVQDTPLSVPSSCGLVAVGCPARSPEASSTGSRPSSGNPCRRPCGPASEACSTPRSPASPERARNSPALTGSPLGSLRVVSATSSPHPPVSSRRDADSPPSGSPWRWPCSSRREPLRSATSSPSRVATDFRPRIAWEPFRRRATAGRCCFRTRRRRTSPVPVSLAPPLPPRCNHPPEPEW